MSEIVSYSVKIDTEQRDALQKKIAESEMTAGNFLSAMLANYEATQYRESMSDIQEINQLKNHLARIEEIYIGLAKSRKDVEDHHDHALDELKKQLTIAKAAVVDTQQAAKTEVEAITKQLLELKENARKQNAENSLQLADIKAQKEVAEETQQQTYKMANVAQQAFEQAQQQIIEFKSELILYKQNSEQASAALAKLQQETTTTNQEITLLKAQLISERETALRLLADQQQQSQFEKQQALLALQEATLTKRESLQDEIVKLRDQLASERERIAQLTIPIKIEQ